ncbi:hypothetical protein OH77DRAFT_1425029 [Trametes cingulata]|nr:hypothetical protein OH77DRAFT_1425029 [Trametes cingulata]
MDRSSEASWPIEYSPECRAPARTPGAGLARGQFLQLYTPSPGSNHSRSVEARTADGGSQGNAPLRLYSLLRYVVQDAKSI